MADAHFWSFCLVVFATSSSAASAAEEDPRHQLCAEGKLPMLSGVGNVIDKTFFNPETEVLLGQIVCSMWKQQKMGRMSKDVFPRESLFQQKGKPICRAFCHKGVEDDS